MATRHGQAPVTGHADPQQAVGRVPGTGRNLRGYTQRMGPVRLRGFLGWITWLVVHLYYLIGFRNRAAVLASWGWDYLRRDRPIRLIVRSRYDPVVAGLVPDEPG